MEIEIISKRENLLLKRFEVRFQVTHPKEPTPKRDDLRQEIAKALSEKKDNVILDWAHSDFGRNRTVGYAKVYRSKEDALRMERKPILVRNGLIAAEAREKPKEKKVAPAKAAPKKEEAKPAEKEAAKPPKKEEAPKKAEAPKAEEKPKEAKPPPAEKPKKAEAGKAEEKKPAKGGK